MAKHSTYKLDFCESRDEETGNRVIRLTPSGVTSHRVQFYQKCFTSDGKNLLVASEFDRNWNFYLIDLEMQIARQLTDGPGDSSFGGFLTRDDKYLYFTWNDRSLIRLNLATLKEDVLYSVPEGWRAYGTWVANSSCTKIIGIEMLQSDSLRMTDWDKFRDQYYLGPHCRIISIDVRKGKSRIIYEDSKWLGHPVYRPFDDNTIVFCHEGPLDLVDSRMWIINEDGGNLRSVLHQEPGECCTYEFWMPDGSRLMYKSFRKGIIERTLHAYDPETGLSEVVMSVPPCNHLMCNNSGTLVVGDGTDTPFEVQDKEGFKIPVDPYLYLFNLKTKSKRHICRHGSSWQVYKGSRQITHPHPSFSPDDTQVLFTSDRDGEPAVYLVDLSE